MLGLGSSLAKGGASLLTFVKDNLKLYLDFKSTKSNTLKFPSEGSTSFAYTDKIMFSQQTFTGAFSVVCWFNGDVNTPYKRLFGDSSPPSGTNDILVKDVSGQVSIRINGNYKANINNVPNNTWSHLAFTRDDNGNIKSYLNGVQSTTSTSTDTFTLDNIGGDGGGAVMSMCNAGLWSRELSQEEVQSIMNKSYSQLKGVEKTSLVAWWALDADSLSEQVFTDTTWATQGSSQTATHNGNFNFTVTNDGTGTQSYRPSIDFPTTAGKTYKMTLTPTSKTGTINALFHNGFNTGGGYQGDFSFDGNSTIVYYYTGFNGGFLSLNGTTGAWSITFDILVQETNYQLDSKGTNHGSTFGATINSNVYGGNAPILPRAIDVAKQGFADPIGNGSASFDGDTDYVEFGTDVYDFSSGDFTLTAWIYHDATNTNHAGIFGVRLNDGNSANTEMQLYVKFDDEKLGSWNGSDNVLSNSAIPDKEWTHVALVQSGSNKKFYINGILDNTASQGNGNQISTATLKIGWTGSAIAENFLGNISQAGIWAGELSQSQIQSVLESTSYSKIPADVKSTLGADFFTDSTFDLSGTQSASTTGTHWTTGSAWTIANGEAIYDGTAHENRLELPSATLQSAGLYKFSFTISDANTKGAFKIKADGNDIIATNYYDNGDHVIYYNQSGAYGSAKTIKIEARNDVHGAFKLQSASWKLVTNDIVAYYPLDADNSANGVTNDATTGEVLGSNTFGGLNQFQPKVVDREVISVSGDELILTIPSANDAGMHTGNLANLGLSTSLGYAVGDLVKLQFEAKIVTNGSGYGETVRWYDSNGYVFPATNISLTSEYQTFTFINEITNLSYSIPSFLRMGNRTGTDVYNLKNFSVQKITSNTGVLK